VIHFLSLKYAPNQTILSEIEKVYGKGAISLQAAEKRTAAFDSGRTEFVDLPRFRRPCDTGKLDLVHVLIKGDGFLLVHRIGARRWYGVTPYSDIALGQCPF
jgi:hypothetical protein